MAGQRYRERQVGDKRRAKIGFMNIGLACFRRSEKYLTRVPSCRRSGAEIRHAQSTPYHVFPDSERFVHSEPINGVQQRKVRIVLDWHEEFRQRDQD